MGTILVGRVPFGKIWHHWVPLVTIGYHSGWQGKVLERFGEFQVCQEANGYGLSDETVTRDAYASKKRDDKLSGFLCYLEPWQSS